MTLGKANLTIIPLLLTPQIMRTLVITAGLLGSIALAPVAEALSVVPYSNPVRQGCTCNRYGPSGQCYDESCYSEHTSYTSNTQYVPHYTNYGGSYTYPHNYYTYPNSRRYHNPYYYGNRYGNNHYSRYRYPSNYGYYNSGNYYPRNNYSNNGGYTGGYRYHYYHNW